MNWFGCIWIECCYLTEKEISNRDLFKQDIVGNNNDNDDDDDGDDDLYLPYIFQTVSG